MHSSFPPIYPSLARYLTKWEQVFDDAWFNDLDNIKLSCDENRCYSRLSRVGDSVKKKRCQCGNDSVCICSGPKCGHR